MCYSSLQTVFPWILRSSTLESAIIGCLVLFLSTCDPGLWMCSKYSSVVYLASFFPLYIDLLSLFELGFTVLIESKFVGESIRLCLSFPFFQFSYLTMLLLSCYTTKIVLIQTQLKKGKHVTAGNLLLFLQHWVSHIFSNNSLLLQQIFTKA